MAVEANTQELDRNTTALQGARTAINGLTSAASKAAQATGLLGELPDSLTEVTASLGAANRAISFFESRFHVLQGLTKFGVNFGYSLKDMEGNANAAGYSLTDLARVVSERGTQMALLGGTMNDAIEGFLERNASIYNSTTGRLEESGLNLNETLRAIGLNAGEIRNTMEQFEILYQTGVYSRFRSDRERNQIAYEYFTVLDDLSRLTGKQRDAIAEELAQANRKGQVQARAMTIDDPELRQAYRTTMGSFSTMFGDGVTTALAQDILGPGSPQSRATAELSVAMQDYTNLLYQAKRHLDAGETELYQATIQRAQMAVVAARNEDNANMAMFRQRSSYGNVIAQMFEETYQVSNVFDSLRQQMESELNRRVSDEEVLARLNNQTNAERQRMFEDFRNQNPNNAFTQMALNANAVFTQAQQAREALLNDAYNDLTSVFNGMATVLRNLNLGDRFTAILGDINVLRTYAFGGPDTDLSVRANQAQATAQGLGPTGVELAAQIGRLNAELGNPATTGSRRVEIQQQLQALMDQVFQLQRSTIDVESATLTITNGTFDLAALNAIRAAQGQPPLQEVPAPAGGESIGTLGNYGRIFKDFGTETITALHGMEAVLTPRQLGDIVHRTVGSALDAVGTRLDNRTETTIPTSIITGMRSIEGRVNTLGNRLPALTQANVPTVDLSPLERAIMQLPAQMKSPFEQAVAGLERELLNNSKALTEIAMNTNATTKNTRGLSGDILRGARAV